MNKQETSYTPGPWKTQTHISLDRLEIRDADGRRIAVCAMDFPMSAKTHDANARLIASAPELLDAVKWASTILAGYLSANSQEERNYMYKDLQHAGKTLDAAIDKAEGRSEK